ncbi:MAG TPA: hypothetical protein EYP14_20195 [Planctomycetaceae bacterium]|nr:hypothetical protein [Planctomycetaceae bacterium]
MDHLPTDAEPNKPGTGSNASRTPVGASPHEEPYVLPDEPRVSTSVRRRVEGCYNRLARTGLPQPLESLLLAEFDLDVSADYGGLPIRNPWGKASGQLSMTDTQVAEDVAAGLGFIVLKTVIAQDAMGQQTMHEWAPREARMVVEPIVGRSGRRGWTVTWKGRGWWKSFDEYLELIRIARSLASRNSPAEPPTLIVPSCKYHLPASADEPWRHGEYEYTTQRLLEAWQKEGPAQENTPMPLEKDFSPTLAGDERAGQQEQVLRWLRTVPQLIRQAAVGSDGCVKTESQAARAERAVTASCPVHVGLKIFNALFDDAFQIAMLRAIHEPGGDRPDFYIYADRLFDPNREFDGKRGVAYGGPDLSDRNLRVMTQFAALCRTGQITSPLPWSATGNIESGRMALEYALRGATSFQLHTFFQLPASEFDMQSGPRTDKVLHKLYFHPESGFVVWMHHLAEVLSLPRRPLRFRDVVGRLELLPPGAG